jgi:NADH-quinone oxidoreductase subunit L
MALALLVLAVGSVAAGWIGIPHALGGHNQLHAWLEPAFEAPVAGAAPEAGGALAPAEAAAESHETLEIALMVFSSAVAVMGILLAYGMWVKRKDLPAAWARRFAPAHQLLLDKYYVDEAYDATIVQPIRSASQDGLWRWFDGTDAFSFANSKSTFIQEFLIFLRIHMSSVLITGKYS